MYMRENICMKNKVTLFWWYIESSQAVSIDDEVYADYKTMIDMQTKDGANLA